MIDRARALLDSSLVWNNHTCLPLRADAYSFFEEIDREKAAGIDVTSINVGFGPQSLESHVRVLAGMRNWFAEHSDRYVVVQRLADIDAARASGKLAVLFDVEGMAILNEGDHGVVEMLRDLGVRWMSIAYNRNNAIGGGCLDDDPGLTAHGRSVLREMRRLGMLVCVSHTGHRTARAVLDEADGPVIFSHSNCSAVHPHARNIPDDLLRACADTGGVIGINGIGAFLDENGRNLVDAFVRHVDHAVQVAGPDHVGLALDYCYDKNELEEYMLTMREMFPDDVTFSRAPDMVEPEALTDIVAGLCKLGYDDETMRKILGGNWRRVAETSWSTLS